MSADSRPGVSVAGPASAARAVRGGAVTGGLANAHAAFAGPAIAHATAINAGSAYLTRGASARARSRPFFSRVLIVCALIPLGGCEWFSDFKKQPVIYPWASADTLTATRGNPQGSVPVSGVAVAGFEVSYSGMPATVDSMSGLVNPTPASAASLANGRMYYQINCAVCHGDRGTGDGPVTQFGMPGIAITGDATRARSDGYIYGMIRNGRGLMPTYNRIEEMDRWDVVNYVRALQSGAAVEVGPLAAPGVTGDKLPGATRRGPTLPSPYFNSPASRVAAPAARPADTSAPAASETASPAHDTAAAPVRPQP